MADILLDVQSAPATPSSGQAVQWFDTTAKVFAYKDDTGRAYAYSYNAAITAQAGGFAADTYVTNSDILIPGFGLQAKAMILYRISCSKTGAGVAAPVYRIRIGTLRTVAGDTARLTLTGPAQTGVADIGTLYVMLTVRSIGASGVLQGSAWWVHRGTAVNTTTSGVGFANDTTGHVEGTSAGFDMTALAGSYIGLSIDGGASAVWSPTQVHVEASW